MKIIRMILWFVMIVSIALLFLLLTDEGEGATITVDDDGDADHTSIQDAIDNANEGDTIRVWAGTYNEVFLSKDSLTFIGNGSSQTIINVTNKVNVVRLGNNNTFTGFSIQSHGSATNGLSMIGKDNCHVSNCAISGYYRGILNDQGDFNTVTQCRFEDNERGGIHVKGSSIFFNITSSQFHNNDRGILLENSGNCTIEDNNFTLNTHGIGIGGDKDGNQCYNNVISNNLISNTKFNAISLVYVGFNTVAGNIISQSRYGISITESSDLTISNNDFQYISYDGITVYDSNNVTIDNNEIKKCEWHGIVLSQPTNCTVIRNELINCSITYGGTIPEQYYSNIIDGTNSVNGKPFLFLFDSNGTIIHEDVGQLILINCSDIRLDSLYLSNVSQGIYLAYCQNITISNSTFSNNSEYGVHLLNVANITFENNTISNNSIGIYSYDVVNIIIINNIFRDNMHSSIYQDLQSYGTISGNRVEGSGSYGLFSTYSDNITLSENEFASNRYNVAIMASQNYLVEGNVIEKGDIGIILRGEHTIVRLNHIRNNDIGISIDGNFSTISVNRNNIYLNSEHGITAFEFKGLTLDAIFNYWGDPSGPYHADNNSQATGDNVSENVIFDPWLEVPYIAPTPHIDSITPTPAHDTDALSFSGHGSGSELITTYSWYSSLDGELYTGPSSSFISTPFSSSPCDPDPPSDLLPVLSPGLHQISLRVMDSTGFWSEVTSSQLTVIRRPRVCIQSISPSPVLTDQNITFSAHTFHELNIMTFVWSSSIDGELYSGPDPSFALHPNKNLVDVDSPRSSSPTPPTRSTIPIPNLSLGIHTISFKALDTAGVWSLTVTETLIVHERPTAFIRSIEPTTAMYGDDVILSGNGTDDGLIVGYLWTSSIDGEYTISTFPQITVFDLSIGNHTISLRVQDDQGAWSDEVTSEIVITPPNLSPQISILENHDGQIVSGTITFRGVAWDEDGEIETVFVSINPGSNDIIVSGTESWSYDLDTTKLENGEHHVIIRSFDGEAYSGTRQITITVQNDDPGEGGGGDDGFIPGFGAWELVISFVLCMWIVSSKKR